MPEPLFKNRFGEGSLYGYRKHANGMDTSLVDEYRRSQICSRETTFEKDTSDTVSLKATLRYFSEKKCGTRKEHSAQSVL